MAGLAAIRAGLATRLRVVLPPDEGQVNEYLLSSPTAPAFEIELDPTEGVEYDQAMHRGWDEWVLIVRGLRCLTSDRGAQAKLDEWLESSGATSVKAGIEGDRTLAGAAQSLQVTRALPISVASPSAPNTVYLAAEWRVVIVAAGA